MLQTFAGAVFLLVLLSVVRYGHTLRFSGGGLATGPPLHPRLCGLRSPQVNSGIGLQLLQRQCWFRLSQVGRVNVGSCYTEHVFSNAERGTDQGPNHVVQRTPNSLLHALYGQFLPSGNPPPDYYKYASWRAVQRLVSATNGVFGTQALIMALGIKKRHIGSVKHMNNILGTLPVLMCTTHQV
jgi:hypothetical protein